MHKAQPALVALPLNHQETVSSHNNNNSSLLPHAQSTACSCCNALNSSSLNQLHHALRKGTVPRLRRHVLRTPVGARATGAAQRGRHNATSSLLGHNLCCPSTHYESIWRGILLTLACHASCLPDHQPLTDGWATKVPGVRNHNIGQKNGPPGSTDEAPHTHGLML